MRQRSVFLPTRGREGCLAGRGGSPSYTGGTGRVGGGGGGEVKGKQHTKFISLPKANLFRQKVEALGRTGILGIRPVATLRRRPTDTLRNRLRQNADRRF